MKIGEMKDRLLTTALACILTALPSAAQFYSLGSEPASVRWNYLETPTYKVIYPAGLDSLAGVYALRLEQAAELVGGSAGFRPNQSFSRRMPVVLHAHTAYSNGMVSWAPRRMELMTMPDPDFPEPTPWETQLAIHESRHAAQMQYTASRPFRGWRIISGQLVSGALAALYCGPSFFEGDAVVAETALTRGGRGRTADFLEYFRVSFAEGSYRDYWRWRYGSQRYYTPDYYRIGYITAAGVRAIYDCPDFTARYYRRIADHGGVAINNFSKTIHDVSGKNLNQAFAEIRDSLDAFWTADELKRAPFMPSVRLTAEDRRYTELDGLCFAGDRLLALRSGITVPEQLVEILPDGSVKILGNFSSSSTGPEYSAAAERLFWTEYRRDPRWELRSFSDIRYMDAFGRRHTLTRGGRYFHPAASPDSTLLAVCEYPAQGGSSIVVLDALDGSRRQVFRAPDGMQLLEPVWTDGELYSSALTEGGYGIVRLSDFSFVLGPQPVKIKQLWSRGDRIMFTSDLSGVNELYELDPRGGSLFQLSSTRFGAADFRFSPDSSQLYYSSLTPGGRIICSTPAASLQRREADFSRLPEYPFAEELAAGEPRKVYDSTAVETGISEPRRYSRLAHLFRFHSWLPLYVDYDAVSSLSLSSLSSLASLGASAFFQNDLGNFWGAAAYKAGFSRLSGWRHSGHLSFSWSGWYPVIEARLDFNDRDAYSYSETEDEQGGSVLSPAYSGKTLLSAEINIYVPLSFSRGGWNGGFIPQLSIAATNDSFEAEGRTEGYMSRMSAGLRGYFMESTPASRIYPRWGVGAELGVNGRPELLSLLCPNLYSYLYGYVPGLWQTHGLKLSAMYEKRIDTGSYSEACLVTAPRGFETMSSAALSGFPERMKFSADYAMPLLPVDWSGLCPAVYVKNFELTLHGDLSLAGSLTSRQGAAGQPYCLFSAGADFCVRLGNLLWIPYDTRIGISYNFKGGNLFQALRNVGYEDSRHSVSLIFSVDL